MSLISMWTHFCWGSCLGADGAAGGPRALAFPDCLSVDTNLERRHAGHPVTDGKLTGRGTHAVSEHRAPLGPALAEIRGVCSCPCPFLIHSHWLDKETWKDGKSEAMNLRLKSPLG